MESDLELVKINRTLSSCRFWSERGDIFDFGEQVARSIHVYTTDF
jgi:hypothetical protein